MRWLSFVICALVFITLQSAVAPYLQVFGARPDWLLVVVVFFALYARGADAVMGAWLIGFIADLMTIEQFGLMSLSYALAALVVVGLRDFLFKYHAVTQFMVTLAICALVRSAWAMFCLMQYENASWTVAGLLVNALIVALYTAAFAPPVDRLLLKMSGLLGLPRRRYTFEGAHSLGDNGV